MSLIHRKWHKIGIKIILIVMLMQDSITHWINSPLVSYLDEVVILSITIISILNILKTGRINKNSLIFSILLIIFLALGVASSIINSKSSSTTLIGGSFLAIKFWLIVVSLMNLSIDKNTEKTLIDSAKVLR